VSRKKAIRFREKRVPFVPSALAAAERDPARRPVLVRMRSFARSRNATRRGDAAFIVNSPRKCDSIIADTRLCRQRCRKRYVSNSRVNFRRVFIVADNFRWKSLLPQLPTLFLSLLWFPERSICVDCLLFRVR